MPETDNGALETSHGAPETENGVPKTGHGAPATENGVAKQTMAHLKLAMARPTQAISV